MEEPKSGSAPPASGLDNNVAGALCYLLGFVTGALFLLMPPYNQNKVVRFHAFQSVFLSIVWIVLWIVVPALLPWMLTAILAPIIGLAFLALWLFLMWKTYQNEKVVLPVVGPLAEKQA